MGKWDALKGKYSNRIEGDPRFIEKVNEARGAYADLSLQGLIHAFTEQRETKDSLNNQLKDVNVELAALTELLVAQLEAQDLHAVKTAAGQTLYISVEPQVGIAERDRFEAWVDAHEDLSYLWSVHAGTLNTFVKDLLEAGTPDEEMPPGIRIFLRSKIGMRKS